MGISSADDTEGRRNSADQSFFTMAGALKRFMPLFDRVLVQKAEAITKTKGGLIIPEKAVAKVNTAKVLAVGDEVMVPDFGGQKIELEGNDYFLYRDTDFLAK